MQLFGFTLVLISFVLSGTNALASDFWSPRTAALGGSSHAGPLLNDAIYLNPSYTSLMPTYSFSANYLFYNGAQEDPDGNPLFHGKNLNFSVQDGRNELFQAGLGYTIQETQKIISAGASRSFAERYGVGLGGKLVFPQGGSRFSDAVFSTSGIPLDWLQVAFIIDNLVQTDQGKQQGFYREYILGTKFNIMKMVLVYFDPQLTPSNPALSTSYGHEAGIEITAMSDFFLRMGTFYNAKIPFENQYGRGYGFGFGWIGPRFSLDYGYSHANAPIVAGSHNMGLTMYF